MATLIPDPATVTKAELRSAGTSPADAYRTALPVQQLIALGQKIVLPPSVYTQLVATPLNINDIIALTGTGSDGRYRVAAIIVSGPNAYHEIDVVGLFGAVIADQGFAAPAVPIPGAAAAMVYQEGARRTGIDTTGLVHTAAANVETAIRDLDAAIAGGGGGGGQSIYGNGADGDHTLVGDEIVTRDMAWNNLNLNGHHLYTHSHRVLVKGTATIPLVSRVRCNGGSAVGVTRGLATLPGSLDSASDGGDGGTAGSPGGDAGSKFNTLGGVGGNGGDAGAFTGGAGGVGTPPNTTTGSLVNATPFALLGSFYDLFGGLTPINGGGGGGGGAAADAPDTGGGGGAGGGTIVFAAHNIVLDGGIEALGGNGADGVAGNGGGGGSGGGGMIFAVYDTISGAGTFSVAPGTPGAGIGDGAPGLSGAPGTIVRVPNT